MRGSLVVIVFVTAGAAVACASGENVASSNSSGRIPDTCAVAPTSCIGPGSSGNGSSGSSGGDGSSGASSGGTSGAVAPPSPCHIPAPIAIGPSSFNTSRAPALWTGTSLYDVHNDGYPSFALSVAGFSKTGISSGAVAKVVTNGDRVGLFAPASTGTGVAMAWTEGTAMAQPTGAWFALFDWSGARVTAPTPLGAAGGIVNVLVTVPTATGFAVVFQGNGQHTFVRPFSFAGTPIGAAQEIGIGGSSSMGSIARRRLAAAWSGTELGVVWEGIQFEGDGVQFVRVAAGGDPIITPVTIDDRDYVSGSVHVVWTGADWVVAYHRQDESNASELVARTVSATGAVVGPPVVVKRVTVVGSGGAHVNVESDLVWNETSKELAFASLSDEAKPGTFELDVRRFTASLVPIGAPASVTKGSASPTTRGAVRLTWAVDEYVVEWNDVLAGADRSVMQSVCF